jgi:membrane-associated protein
VPIIRTFAPFVAGVANMRYRSFISFDVFGATGWVVSMTVLGYLLGQVPLLRRNFEKFVLLIVFVSLLPAIYQAARAVFQRKPGLQAGD